MVDLRNHWNTVFRHKPAETLGWYERYPAQTLELLKRIPEENLHTIFLPGAGTSTLTDVLRAHGYTLLLNDISDVALHRLRQRIGSGENLIWIQGDIAAPLPDELPPVDLWIDRAVLHFLTEEAQIQAYFANVHRLLRPGGYLLLAEYASTGPPTCAGRPVHRYTLEEMDQRVGSDFSRLYGHVHLYVTPSGESCPYLYALYQRNPE